MTNPTEINRYLATEVMGIECFHDFQWIPEDKWRCFYCSQGTYDPDRYPNPDYLTNLSDRQDLLEACVEKEWWDSFMLNLGYLSTYDFFTELFIPREALASAIYRYLKEVEDETS